MRISNYQAIMFDLDGTLLHTVPDLLNAFNTSLASQNLPTVDERTFTHLIGYGIREVFHGVAKPGVDPALLEQALAFYQVYYPEHCTIKTAPYPGVREALHRLMQEDIRLAVITNKTETTGQKIISHFFPEVPFTFVWGNNGKRPLKPAVDAGVLACETLRCKPEQILYVGDGDTDMKFAKAMGFTGIGVTWGYRSPAELLEAGANVLVNSYDELVAYLLA